MNTRTILRLTLGVVAMAIIAFIIIEDRADKKRELSKYENPKYGLEFSYPNEYILATAQIGDLLDHLRVTLALSTPTPNPSVPTEVPPAITIDIYENKEAPLGLTDWLKTENSNFKLSNGRFSSTTLSGYPAISYRWDGLYASETVALALGDYIYAFSVGYIDSSDQIADDFQELLKSTKITETNILGQGDEEKFNFVKQGVAVKNSPGSEDGKLYILYEEPGKPALRAELKFNGQSECGSASQKIICLALSVSDFGLYDGRPIRVIGNMEGNVVTVRRVEY